MSKQKVKRMDDSQPTEKTAVWDRDAGANYISDFGKDRKTLMSIKSLPPVEVGRLTGESMDQAARRYLDVATGCYGD